MTKNNYLNFGLLSLLAVILLVIMTFSWPLTDYSLNDVILGNIKLSTIDKGNLIKSIGINYGLDSIFIFSWIASWAGLYLHFKSLNVKLIGICFGLSLLGALLDITENTISFSLLIENHKTLNTESFIVIHSIIAKLSYWLPMLASFMLVLIIPKHRGISNSILAFSGTIGVLFAVLGMYIQYFSAIPDYWFGLWFFATSIFFFDNYRKTELI